MDSSKARHAMMIRADAKAQGMTTATRVGGDRRGTGTIEAYIGGKWRPSRCVALTECVSIMPDGTKRTFQPKTTARKSDPVARRNAAIDAQNKRDARYGANHRTAAQMPAIGDLD